LKLTINKVKKPITAKLPVHPDYPDRGNRVHVLEPKDEMIHLYLSGNDLDRIEKGKLVRLMGIANIKITSIDNEIMADYHSEDYQIAREKEAPFINWLPVEGGVDAKVIMPDASEAVGLAEASVINMKPDDMFQFERFGYCRVEQSKPFVAYFAHN
jgi:glutamyl-tRNA synthetase